MDTAVILAAGEGKRLRPLTRYRPKPMLPVAGSPVLERVFDAVLEVGVTNLHVVVGYKRDRVRESFGSTYRNAEITYHIQEKQLGSGHAFAQTAGVTTDPVLVVNGDQIIAPMLADSVIDAHEKNSSPATLSAVKSEKAAVYGAVTLREGVVTELIEGRSEREYGLLNAGVYVFDPEVYDAVERTPRIDGSTTLPGLIEHLIETDRRVEGVDTTGYWSDATYPWDLPAVTRGELNRGAVSLPQRSDGVWTADSATVADSATLRRPVAVLGDAAIAPQTVIGPNTAVGQNVTIGANSVVEGSVIDDDSRIGPGSVVVDSVLGQQVSLGSGASLSGGRADVQIGETVYPDHRLGTVLADRAVVEGGVTFRPGTLVGAEATVRAGVVVSENVPADAEVRN